MKKRIPIQTATVVLAAASLTAGFARADEEKGRKEESKPRSEQRDNNPRENNSRDSRTGPRESKPREPKPEEQRSRGDVAENKQTWLGVATTPVPANLREYLGLAEGFGIQIHQVVEGSPAAEAGVLANDVMVKLDDQKLTTPDHLALLVRSMKGGDKVTITVIRKGTEKTLNATLGTTDRPLHSPTIIPGAYDRGGRPMHGYIPGENLRGDPRDWQEAARHFQDHWENWMKENRRAPQNPDAPKREEERKDPEPKQDAEKEKASTNRTPALSVNPGFPLKIFGMRGIVKIDNEEGELTITNTEDGQTITILNRDGEEVYEGAFDPDKGVEGLPKEARDQLEKMKLDNLDILPMPPVAEKDNKVEEASEIVDRKKEKGPVL